MPTSFAGVFGVSTFMSANHVRGNPCCGWAKPCTSWLVIYQPLLASTLPTGAQNSGPNKCSFPVAFRLQRQAQGSPLNIPRSVPRLCSPACFTRHGRHRAAAGAGVEKQTPSQKCSPNGAQVGRMESSHCSPRVTMNNSFGSLYAIKRRVTHAIKAWREGFRTRRLAARGRKTSLPPHSS